MTKFLLSILLTLTYLQASCKEYELLGAQSQNQTSFNSKDTIVWDKVDSVWSVSKPLKNYVLTSKICKESGFVLVANNKKVYKTLIHKKNYYDIKKGWNTFNAPINGIDVANTFKDVDFVFTYDKHSGSWAGYSSKTNLIQKIKSTRILELRYIEPKIEFYVLSSKNKKTKISSKVPNAQCQKIMRDKNYDVIIDSGIDKGVTFNSIQSIALASRYHSHNRKGIYNDTRIIIMVPKVKNLSKNKTPKKYGPAIPKMMILFNEAYEEKEFYSYDFLNAECRKGYFPSKKRPPAPSLSKVK